MIAIVRDGPANQAKNLKKAGIYLLDKPVGKSVQLLPCDFAPPFGYNSKAKVQHAIWQSPTWASNNTILVQRVADQKYNLLKLG